MVGAGRARVEVEASAACIVGGGYVGAVVARGCAEFGPAGGIAGGAGAVGVEVLGVGKLVDRGARRGEGGVAPVAGVGAVAEVGHAHVVVGDGGEVVQLVGGVGRIDRHHAAVVPAEVRGLVLQDVAAAVLRDSPGNRGGVRGDARHAQRAHRMAVHVGGLDFQLDLVLHRQAVAGRVGRPDGVVVRSVAIDVHGAVGGTGEHAALKAAAPAHVLVHNESEIAHTVVGERRGELDGRPCTCREGDIALEHKVGRSDRHPVGGAGELRLGGVHHVDFDVGGLGSSPVVERDAGDDTAHAHLLSRVNLLREGVVVERVGWQIAAGGRATVAQNLHKLLRRRLPGAEPQQNRQQNQ